MLKQAFVFRLLLCGGFAWCATALPATGQVTRLPAVDLSPSPYPGRQTGYPDSTSEILQRPGGPGLPAHLEPPGFQPQWPADEALLPQPSPTPPGVREGVFQKLIFDGGWGPRLGRDGLGMSELQLKAVLALPFPTRESPLLITPGFRVHYLDGPAHPDMPPRLYDAYCQFRWLVPVTDRLGFDLAFRPGYFSDFEKSSSEAVRYGGHLVAAWDWTPHTKLIMGAAYVDRRDVNILPAVGLIWKPYDEAVVELMFPRPRFAHQIDVPWGAREGVEHWIYLAGEFGGGTWAIQRADRTDDVVTYRDFRVILGTERKVLGGLDTWLEAAYLFGRRLEYRDASSNFAPLDSFLVRGGVAY